MSTRAVITVFDDTDTFHIYTHSDGYPSYTAKRIANALDYAFTGHFNAGDFAAAIIAGNAKDKRYMSDGKCLSQGGEVYLTTGPETHGDLEYRYEVTGHEKALMIKAYRIDFDDNESRIFSGPLAKFQKWIASEAQKSAR